MIRTLRHVEVPACHDRIPEMRAEGRAKIREASTGKLQDTIRRLASFPLLADEMWTVWYEVKDELLERDEWSNGLAIRSDPSPLWGANSNEKGD